MSKFIPTFEKVTVSDYPYGFKLRCTLYDFIEFDPKKGYRHCTQTVNPKTNRINNPKKSTYSNLIVRYYEPETNHIKALHFSFNGKEEINQAVKFINDNFELFTEDEMIYLYTQLHFMLYIDMTATIRCAGAKKEHLDPLYRPAFERLNEGIRNPETNYLTFQLDIAEINFCKAK